MTGGTTNPVARKAWRWLARRALIEFTRRDLWQGVKGGQVEDAERDLVPALEELSRRGFIRKKAASTDRGRGRPSEVWMVNPEALRLERV